MRLDKLFQVLSAIHPMSEDFKKAIEQEVTYLSLPSHHMLLEAPRIAAHAYFLDDGFAMSYTFIKGKKQVECFCTQGQFIVSVKSFFEQVPSQEFIQLMKQSEVLCISYASVLRLFHTFPEANFIYRVLMNQYYEQSRERIRELHHLSAYARYKKLREVFPPIEQILPQEHIASYLGIAPQSLSRIKKQRGHT